MSPPDPWADFLTASVVVGLHDEALTQSGGMPGGPTSGCVEGSLGNAWSAEVYGAAEDESARRGLIFAGHVLFYLAKNHCFTDGNKRVALAATQVALGRLGLTVEVEEDELVAFIESVAAGGVESGGDVVQWLARRLSELE